jgi:arylformamidase
MQKVFLDYDQKALDDAYDQAVYASNIKLVHLRRNRGSLDTRRRVGEPTRKAYGRTANEMLDIFPARRSDGQRAPVNVFIHGGAWLSGSAQDFSAPAEMLGNAGAAYVALDFDNVNQTGGDLMPMADQVKRAVAWVCRNAESFGGDPKRIYVSGCSSGAHLGGVVAITDWKEEFGLPADAVKGYTLCSGMYDLRGPRLSKRSAYVKFTDPMEHALSAQRHLERIRSPIVLLYGSEETPEFKRQSMEFADALKAAGKTVELICCEGYNHFEMQETLANPYGPMGRAVLEQMGLSTMRESR